MDNRTKEEQTTEANGVRQPESALRRERVMAPKAGNVPGTKEPTRLLDPSATNSLFRLIGYPNRALFCLDATIESRKPAIDIRL